MLRKFFDPAAAEAKAEPRVQFGEAITLDEVFQSQSEQFLEKKEEEETTEEKTEVKEDTTEVKSEETKEVTEEKKEEVVEETKAPVTQDWKEYVKNPQYRKEVHNLLEIDEDALNLSKELAQDEFVKKLVTYRKEHGNVTPFIEAATKDYDKFSHIDLLRDDLKKQYPTLTKEKFEILAKNRIDKRFILGEDADPEEVELASVDLEVEGERIRQLRKTEQQTFLDSVKPVDRTAAVQKEVKEKLDADLKEFEDFRQSIETSPVTSKLFAEKKVVFGEKENSFNYTVNPDTIKEQTLDTNKFYANFWEGDKFNQHKWNKVVAYANNMAVIEEAFVNHGRSLGTKQIVENELENVTEKTDQSTKVVKKSLAKTFAENGQAITLQELYGG
jgi:hypothetical protein